ncbi:hypothetical protein DFH08DRAFT_819906 [Mycena albidolilacea]|uniref:Uncharacterized protein n=1 Tax=Mycena albidolilacea TaxID=1033008 RepID=A0AAD6ZDW6_9AGAR|nr:hypothetical protein DFH08DRAFT_819906 [Mycena albidolilacea]
MTRWVDNRMFGRNIFPGDMLSVGRFVTGSSETAGGSTREEGAGRDRHTERTQRRGRRGRMGMRMRGAGAQGRPMQAQAGVGRDEIGAGRRTGGTSEVGYTRGGDAGQGRMGWVCRDGYADAGKRRNGSGIGADTGAGVERTSVARDTSEGRIRRRGEEKDEEREEKDKKREGGNTPISRSQGSNSKAPHKHGTRDLEAQPELQVAPSTRCVFASAQNRCGWGAQTKSPVSSSRDAAARQQSEAVMGTTEEERIGCASQSRGSGEAGRDGRGGTDADASAGAGAAGTGLAEWSAAGTQGWEGTRRGFARGGDAAATDDGTGVARRKHGEDEVARRNGMGMGANTGRGWRAQVLGSVGSGRGGRVQGRRGGRAVAAAEAQKSRRGEGAVSKRGRRWWA